jgi:hypothetical protein
MSERRPFHTGNRSVFERLDDWVRRGGERLAGGARGLSRRGLLESVGIGAAAAGILSQSSGERHDAACTLPAGCFGTEDVNVCYTPWKCVAAEPGRTDGVVLRKGPSFTADPILHSDGVTPAVVPIGGHFGRCSNRTGSVANGCPDPGPRVNQHGFLWGYPTSFAKQGWMPYSVGGVTYAVGDNGYTGTMCGPAGADFDCRLAKSACTGYNGCGGAGVGSPTCSVTIRPIIAVGTDLSEQKYYLRYGANSTTFAWLVPGDKIKRYGYKDGGTYNWSCVEVICAKFAPHGCRGWVRSDALGSPISSAAACYPDVACPAGSS